MIGARALMASSLVFGGRRLSRLAVEAAVSEVTIASGCVVDEPERAASGVDARLHGVRELLVALGNALANRFPEDDLEAQFEQHVRQMLGLRSVRLREVRARYQARLVTPTRTNDSIVLGVPGSDARVQAVLEASCDSGRRFDEHDLEVLTAVAQIGGLVMEISRCRAPARARSPVSVAPLIGSTSVMHSLRERVERVAATDFTVLVEGESGTGKELVARQVHELSRRRNGPFVAVNCAAVVETLLEAELFGIEERTATGVRGRRGKFEHADGGTLFLDEVSDLSLSAQAKLLRVIQDLAVERVGGQGVRRVNTRIIAATNRPLSELTVRGLFRADLYYRLSGVEVHVPPLRSRRGDIPELARYFLERHRHARDLTLSPQAEEALNLHAWPGNVRELERLMERAVALAVADRIELDDLPAAVRGEYEETLGPALAGNESFRRWGSRYARLVFERCGRNKRRACRVLDISYHTLQAYLRYSDRRAREQAKQLPAWVRSASDAIDGDAESGA
jgi:transcriptional regulator with PAS, ATPase and Fis domain